MTDAITESDTNTRSESIESGNQNGGWEITTEAIGWVGVIMVLAAYGLTTFSVISGHSFLFMSLNLFGAIGIAIDSWEDKNIQLVVLNIVWATIAVIGLIGYFN